MLLRKMACLPGIVGSSARTPLKPANRICSADGSNGFAIFVTTCNEAKFELSCYTCVIQCQTVSMKCASTKGRGARFSKVPKLFGDIKLILFVSSNRRCSVSRNLAVVLIFIPFTTYGKTSFTK